MSYSSCYLFLIAEDCSGYNSEEKCNNCPKRNPKLKDSEYVMEFYSYIPEDRKIFKKLMRQGGCLKCGSGKKPVDLRKRVYRPDVKQKWMIFECPDCGAQYRIRITCEDFILLGADGE